MSCTAVLPRLPLLAVEKLARFDHLLLCLAPRAVVCCHGGVSVAARVLRLSGEGEGDADCNADVPKISDTLGLEGSFIREGGVAVIVDMSDLD